jgi:BlaI family penicillinase repressor
MEGANRCWVRSETLDSLVRADDALPPEIDALAPRMREIARIVYLRGGATAREVQDDVDDPLTICGIRTLMNRLAKRGLVKRRRSGRHTEILYLPTILTDGLRRIALRQLIMRSFGGSTASALQTMLQLISSDETRAPLPGSASGPSRH